MNKEFGIDRPTPEQREFRRHYLHLPLPYLKGADDLDWTMGERFEEGVLALVALPESAGTVAKLRKLLVDGQEHRNLSDKASIKFFLGFQVHLTDVQERITNRLAELDR